MQAHSGLLGFRSLATSAAFSKVSWARRKTLEMLEKTWTKAKFSLGSEELGKNSKTPLRVFILLGVCQLGGGCMRPPQESSRKSDDLMMVLMGTIKRLGSPFHKFTRSMLGVKRESLITAQPPARALFPLDKAEWDGALIGGGINPAAGRMLPWRAVGNKTVPPTPVKMHINGAY